MRKQLRQVEKMVTDARKSRDEGTASNYAQAQYIDGKVDGMEEILAYLRRVA